MEPDRKSNVSIALSLLAIGVALFPIYMKYLAPITLELVVSRDIFISNTWGGIPDATMRFALRAHGPETKSITVDSVRVTLKNLTTEEQHELGNPAKGEEFPTILQGGQVKNYDLIVIVNDYVAEEINPDYS